MLFKPGLFLCCLLICLSSCTTSSWQKVDLAKRRGNLAELEREMERHVRSHPSDGKAQYQLGEIKGKLKKWPEMVAAFRAAEKADHRWEEEIQTAREYYWRQNFNEGILAVEKKFYDQAATYFANATLIFPRRPPAQRLEAESHLALGDTSHAKSLFMNAIQQDSSDSRSRRFLVKLSFNQQHYTAAVDHAGALLTLLPADLEAMRIKAYCHDILDDEANAKVAYERLIQNGNAADLASYAAFQYRYGNYSHAAELHQQAINRGGKALPNQRAIAQCKLMEKDYAGLIEITRAILITSPNDPMAAQLLKVAYAATGETKEMQSISRGNKDGEGEAK